jgi:hypothetical protein
MAFYAQDSWKVTRKVTLSYGLRDLQTLLRNSTAACRAPTLTSPIQLPHLPGAVDYEANCNCDWSDVQIRRTSIVRGLSDRGENRVTRGIGYRLRNGANNAFLA